MTHYALEQSDRLNQVLSGLGESISMLQDQMTHYTLEEMKELFANYSKLTAKQKYLIMQSIRHIIANFNNGGSTKGTEQ